MLKIKTKNEQYNFLVSLKGVGEKVANCIMLFGLGVKDVFLNMAGGLKVSDPACDLAVVCAVQATICS